MIWLWQNRSSHCYKLNAIYQAIGITKQSFHERLNRLIRREEESEQLLPLIHQIRHDHPSMSSRVMYHMLRPESMGRDRFERFCFERGFKVARKYNPRRTTNSSGVKRFENQLDGRELNDINQVWVSDITYYDISEKCYYLTFIMDLYSRRIVGYSAAERLFTEQTTIPAIQMAINQRNCNLDGLVVHSDGGGQYYSQQYLSLTKGMINSMGRSVYENLYAERLNGTIKNDYLRKYGPKDLAQLQTQLKRSVDNYNKRPHHSLRRHTPLEIESTKPCFLRKQGLVNQEQEIKMKNTSIINLVS